MTKALHLWGALAFLAAVAGDARAQEPYVIDTMLPLTGAAAFLGKGEQIRSRLQRASSTPPAASRAGRSSSSSTTTSPTRRSRCSSRAASSPGSRR